MSRLGGDGAAVELTTETIIWVDLHDPINGASFRPSPLKPIPWLTWGGGVEGEAQRNVRSESSEHPTAAVSHQIHGSIEDGKSHPAASKRRNRSSIIREEALLRPSRVAESQRHSEQSLAIYRQTNSDVDRESRSTDRTSKVTHDPAMVQEDDA